MNEQQRILEMIEKGQITAAEGMELLEALGKAAIPAFDAPAPSTKRSYKFLKVKVTSENGAINVNVNAPIRLIATIGEIATKMSAVIPPEARNQMESKGIDISQIDFGKVIEEILNGTLDDPTIVDVEVMDPENGKITVKVYVE